MVCLALTCAASSDAGLRWLPRGVREAKLPQRRDLSATSPSEVIAENRETLKSTRKRICSFVENETKMRDLTRTENSAMSSVRIMAGVINAINSLENTSTNTEHSLESARRGLQRPPVHHLPSARFSGIAGRLRFQKIEDKFHWLLKITTSLEMFLLFSSFPEQYVKWNFQL